MRTIAAATLSALLVASQTSAAIAPFATGPLGTMESIHHQPASLQVEQLAFAKDCDDDLWKFSLIEALTCLISGQWS